MECFPGDQAEFKGSTMVNRSLVADEEQIRTMGVLPWLRSVHQ